MRLNSIVNCGFLALDCVILRPFWFMVGKEGDSWQTRFWNGFKGVYCCEVSVFIPLKPINTKKHLWAASTTEASRLRLTSIFESRLFCFHPSEPFIVKRSYQTLDVTYVHLTSFFSEKIDLF